MPEELTLQRQHGDEVSLAEVMKPINGDATNKNLLSMRQLSEPDIYGYITEAYAAEHYRNSPQRGLNLLPFHSLKAVMKQPSTRTGGSMTTAMQKLGGSADLISGMSASSEAKGESIPDSNIAFATQADIIGMRTAEEYGPMDAAREMIKAVRDEEIPFAVPVINLGDGRNEHPTQTLGDLFTMHKIFVDQRGGELSGKTLVTVGDQERYRAIHSLILGSVAVGMNVIAVESSVSRIPTSLINELSGFGGHIELTEDLDSAMRFADILYVGRNPDEYDGKDNDELERSRQLALDYASWIVDYERIQQMKQSAIIMHPRPRRNELHPSADLDPRTVDIPQMFNMIPMRMAIIAKHLGVSIREHLELEVT